VSTRRLARCRWRLSLEFVGRGRRRFRPARTVGDGRISECSTRPGRRMSFGGKVTIPSGVAHAFTRSERARRGSLPYPSGAGGVGWEGGESPSLTGGSRPPDSGRGFCWRATCVSSDTQRIRRESPRYANTARGRSGASGGGRRSARAPTVALSDGQRRRQRAQLERERRSCADASSPPQ